MKQSLSLWNRIPCTRATKPRREVNFLKKLVHGPTSWSVTVLRTMSLESLRNVFSERVGKRTWWNERVLSPWYQRRMCLVIFKLEGNFAPRSFRNGEECCPRRRDRENNGACFSNNLPHCYTATLLIFSLFSSDDNISSSFPIKNAWYYFSNRFQERKKIRLLYNK